MAAVVEAPRICINTQRISDEENIEATLIKCLPQSSRGRYKCPFENIRREGELNQRCINSERFEIILDHGCPCYSDPVACRNQQSHVENRALLRGDRSHVGRYEWNIDYGEKGKNSETEPYFQMVNCERLDQKVQSPVEGLDNGDI